VAALVSFVSPTGSYGFRIQAARARSDARLVADFLSLHEIRDLATRGIVRSLAVIFNGDSNSELSLLRVQVRSGTDATGVTFAESATAALPKKLGGVTIIVGPDRELHTQVVDPRQILAALRAFTNFVGSEGVRSLIERRAIDSLEIDFSAPPPEIELYVTSVSEVERLIPASVDGFPVRVDVGGVHAYGTLKSRPGRNRRASP
jgi:hypothetical protein